MIDINKPIENPKLIKAMLEMEKDGAEQSQFFEELFKAHFLCPVEMDMKGTALSINGKVTLDKDTKISLLSLQNNSGQYFLMAFTDWKELSKWSQDANTQTLVFQYEDYQQMIAKESSLYAGVVINPFSNNIVLNQELLKTLYPQNIETQTVEKEEFVMIGIPADYPTKMVEKLKKVFSRISSIKSAYLLWMVRNEEMSYLLIVDDEEETQKNFPEIGKICQPYLNGKLLDMVPLNSQFGKNAVKEHEPFYKV